jgi:tetratricopeptide (TPR) repeat protein
MVHSLTWAAGRRRWGGILGCLAGIVMVAGAYPQTDPEAYREALRKAEEAKRAGDFAAMAAAIRTALQHGPGDEYAWRSLAWALDRAGQWQESLAMARENVARNGVCGWSLEQLAESYLGAGDFAAAREALDQAEALSAEKIGSAREALNHTRQRLLDLTGQRRYQLHWQVDLGQGGPDEPPARLLMPRWNDPRQSFEFTVSNAVSWERVSTGPRDFIDVVQKPGEPFQIDATVTIKAFALGRKALLQPTPFQVPEALQSCLTPFHHSTVFDPALPLCAEIAASLKADSMAQTVQNVLDWQHANMKYESVDGCSLEQILTDKKGVCHHFCSSFVALCRAAGVPAAVAHGIVLPAAGEFQGSNGSHGWALVYIVPFGWVPVEPLDPGSLALFGRSNYLLTDYANLTPDDDHFAYRSIQGFPCDGEVVAVEPP